MSNLAKPAVISLETLPQLFAYHRSRFGGWRMEVEEDGGAGGGETPPAQPDGVSDEEWKALGDPGKAALVRERKRAEEAERKLAATIPKPGPPPSKKTKTTTTTTPPAEDGGPDVAALIQQAVEAAVAPLMEREQQREAQAAVEKVRDTIIEAAKPLLIDPTDAAAHIDLASVVDDSGAADSDKIATALDELMKARPHLVKPDARRAPHGIGATTGSVGSTEEEQIKASVARMERATGVRFSSEKS